MRARCIGLLVVAFALGCDGGGEATLVVALKTDFVPLVEFTHVVVRAGGAERTYAVTGSEDFGDAVAVAEISGLDPVTDVRVEVELLDRDRVLVARPLLVDLTRRAVAVTVVVTRSCRDVTCPGADNPSATACLGGRCVDERCTEETPQYCQSGMAGCRADVDCPSMDACSRPSCQLGACLYEPASGACGDGQICLPATGCVEMPVPGADAGVRDAGGGPMDAGPPPMPDAGDPCDAVVCDPLEICVDGACQALPPCRGDGTCAEPTDVCHGRRCVPGDLDLDGDGVPASLDCDELDPERFPGNPEVCNLLDEDCDGVPDNGDPATLCETYPGGGICIDGSCGCPVGTYDLDRSIAGCECVADPPLGEGVACASAIDLGSLDDSGAMRVVSGNVMPDDREVWYRFHATDIADTACDNFHVRVHFTDNPGNSFELTGFRGDCATAVCSDAGYTDMEWATDFRADLGGGLLGGQCPCTAIGSPRTTDVSGCEDDSADYLVRVRRRAGSTLTCSAYAIEISNGVYDTM
ncbi:MAG: putative metal-binding motif-containing protein [Myxococcales bacterium]|nr:putative metal-binding motif-containing protein [Myxococcales bacterium]